MRPVLEEEGGTQFEYEYPRNQTGSQGVDATGSESVQGDASLSDADNCSGLSDTLDDATAGGDAMLGGDVDVSQWADGQEEQEDSTDAGLGAVDTLEGLDASANDADVLSDTLGEADSAESGEEDTGTESGSTDENEFENCKQGCAVDDLECTGVCGGSPLCLAQCAAAYTECLDGCKATYGD